MVYSPSNRSLRGVAVTKPCPEQREGTLEIATGFALATTFHVGLPRLRAETLACTKRFRDGSTSACRHALWARNDNFL